MSIKAGYQYGPPVTVTVVGGANASTTPATDTVVGADASTSGAVIDVVGGSPSDESGKGHTATITVLTPATVDFGVADTVVTVTGTNFTRKSYVKYGTVVLATTYVSATSLTAVFPTAARTTIGTVAIRVQDGAKISATTVNFTYTDPG